MKRTVNFAVKIFGLNAAAMIAALFLVPVYAGFWSDKAFFQWFMTSCFLLALAILIWIPAGNTGVKDYMHDEIMEKNQNTQEKCWFRPANGFLAGFLAQVPAVILIILCLFLPDQGRGTLPAILLEGWFFLYKRFMDTWPQAWLWVAAGGVAFCSAVTGLAYLNGRELRLRTKVIIARNDAKRAKKKPANR
jgi:hypothetical protein